MNDIRGSFGVGARFLAESREAINLKSESERSGGKHFLLVGFD